MPYPGFSVARRLHSSIHDWTNQSDLASRIRDATIVLNTTIHFSAGFLSSQVTTNLRLIVIMASGTDCVEKEATKAQGITVCDCPGTNVDSVSEHAIGLYFAVRRRFVDLHNTMVAVPEEMTHDTDDIL